MTRIVDYYRAKGILPMKEENKRSPVSNGKPTRVKQVNIFTSTHEASTAFDTPLFPPVDEAAFVLEVATENATKENEVESNKEESEVQELITKKRAMLVGIGSRHLPLRPPHHEEVSAMNVLNLHVSYVCVHFPV